MNTTIARPKTLAPQDGPPGPKVSRRTVLVRGGAGLLVLGAGGTLWRAQDQGVFATGEGPAYDA